MKAAILAVALLVLASPAQAATWGPGDSGVSPTYPVPIRVIDAVWINPDHRQAWYEGRNEAFRQWGLPFSIEQGTVTYEWTQENVDSGLGAKNIQPGAIILVRDRTGLCQNSGGYGPLEEGGIVIVCPWAAWWKDARAIPQVVAHEVGHALGFFHGGNGVMGGAYRVNDEERALAQAYYGV